MTTPENTFIGSVHKHIDRALVHAEKTNNPYRGGAPDVYYEGSIAFWVEYKFLELPKRADTLIKPNLSELQRDWLQRNYDNGHNPLVIVGCPAGGYVFRAPGAWNHGVTAGAFVETMLTRKQIADLLVKLARP